VNYPFNKPLAFRQHVIVFFSLSRLMASDSIRMLKRTTMLLKVPSYSIEIQIFFVWKSTDWIFWINWRM